MNAFDKIFRATTQSIENDLRARGETMLPGNPDFEALVEQIEINRKDRESYEQAMSTPIRHWNLG